MPALGVGTFEIRTYKASASSAVVPRGGIATLKSMMDICRATNSAELSVFSREIPPMYELYYSSTWTNRVFPVSV